MGMKDILFKLANGNNNFECTVFGEKRNCEILKLDLYDLINNKGRALVKFDNPVKKIIRREIENNSLGSDPDYSQYEDFEIDTYEEWVDIN